MHIGVSGLVSVGPTLSGRPILEGGDAEFTHDWLPQRLCVFWMMATEGRSASIKDHHLCQGQHTPNIPLPTVTQNRLDNVVICLAITTHSLQIIADSMKTPFLGAIINTTQAVLKNIQLLEQIHKLLNAIMIIHIKSDAGGEMPIEVLDHVGKFTEYWPCPLEIHDTLTTEIRILHKIYTFIEAQQKGNRVKSFFRQGTRAFPDIAEMKKDAQKRHQEVLDMIEKFSEATVSERASTVWYPSSLQKPKIFHGRESELSDILHLFNTGIPRIAILGACSIGKTSLARAVLHHPDIAARYVQNRFFVACNSATTKIELANLIGSHLGLKPGKDLTQAVLQHFSNNPPSLLILDELETLWEPASSRANIEELLSLLIVDTAWRRLTKSSPWQTTCHLQSVCLPIWLTLKAAPMYYLAGDKEKASVTSEGFDKRLNLDMSISLSLSSPRIQSVPHSQELLSLLAMLTDGLTDVDFIQSKLPLENILKCKTTLKSTALAYSDEHKRLKVLMPIRQYLQQYQPPGDHLVQSLFKYFQEMLKFYTDYMGTQSSSSTIPQIKSNLTNIQNVLQWGLKQKQPTLSNSIYCVQTFLMGQIQDLLPQLNDCQLKAYFLIESISLWKYYPISDPEALASQVVELFKDFDDPNLKCRFYLSMSSYYQAVKNDLGQAANMCKKLISLATQTGNIRRHSHGLTELAQINHWLGAYSVAQIDAHESQKSVKGFWGSIWRSKCCPHRSHLLESAWAQSLLDLCGMAGSEANRGIMNTQAEVHKYKSEYSQAWTIQTKILQTSTDQHAYWHAFALLNVAEIGVFIGVQKHDVQRKFALARYVYQEKGSSSSKETIQKVFEIGHRTQ
ncbi:hypothetical protein B0H14DRAFT_3132919 [Mycena olivaceomarginata]|nr:hypothetical protein B0H14DRAFT_3132919 [Mycena olivaceomarginata]